MVRESLNAYRVHSLASGNPLPVPGRPASRSRSIRTAQSLTSNSAPGVGSAIQLPDLSASRIQSVQSAFQGVGG